MVKLLAKTLRKLKGQKDENGRDLAEKFKNATTDAVHLDIQNVTDYYYFGTGETFEDSYNDFPNIAPPWEKCWLEWTLPNKIRIKNETKTIETAPGTTAVLVLAREHPHSDLVPEARWEMDFHCFLPSTINPYIGWYKYFVDENGRVIFKPGPPPAISKSGPSPDLRILPRAISPHYMAIAQEAGMSPQSLMETIEASCVDPVWLAFCFCHCKNVQLKEHSPNKKESSAHRRIYGAPLVKYHTLEIDPMKKILRHEGQSETLGLKRALSICRGHFSEYGPEFGKGKLFGKLEGRFWIPQHLTGSAEHGVIKKDYAINAPQGVAS